MSPAKKALQFVEENDAQFVDIRFTDLMGTWQHFSIPVNHFDEGKFEDGLAETVAWYKANEAWWRPLKAKAALK